MKVGGQGPAGRATDVRVGEASPGGGGRARSARGRLVRSAVRSAGQDRRPGMRRAARAAEAEAATPYDKEDLKRIEEKLDDMR